MWFQNSSSCSLPTGALLFRDLLPVHSHCAHASKAGVCFGDGWSYFHTQLMKGSGMNDKTLCLSIEANLWTVFTGSITAFSDKGLEKLNQMNNQIHINRPAPVQPNNAKIALDQCMGKVSENGVFSHQLLLEKKLFFQLPATSISLFPEQPCSASKSQHGQTKKLLSLFSPQPQELGSTEETNAWAQTSLGTHMNPSF